MMLKVIILRPTLPLSGRCGRRRHGVEAVRGRWRMGVTVPDGSDSAAGHRIPPRLVWLTLAICIRLSGPVQRTVEPVPVVLDPTGVRKSAVLPAGVVSVRGFVS